MFTLHKTRTELGSNTVVPDSASMKPAVKVKEQYRVCLMRVSINSESSVLRRRRCSKLSVVERRADERSSLLRSA